MRLFRFICFISGLLMVTLNCTFPSAIGDTINQQIKQQATNIAIPKATAAAQPLVYFDSTHTEVVPFGDLVAVKSATIKGVNNLSTYVLVENKSSDPLWVLNGLKYKISWMDDQNKEIAASSGQYDALFMPQEKVLISVSATLNDNNKNSKVNLARFEITSVISAAINESYSAKIRSLKLSHPVLSVAADSYEIQQKDFFDVKFPVATARVTIQNNLNNKMRADVVGLFLNNSGDVVGVGLNANLLLPPLGSGIVVISTPNLSAPVVRAEYYATIYSRSTWSDVYYQALK